MIVQVVDQATKRRDFSADALLGAGNAGRRHKVVGVGLPEVEALGTCPHYQVQRLGQLQAQAAIQTILALRVGAVVALVVTPIARVVKGRTVGVKHIGRRA
ncbi:hypothetical protein D3C80_1081000 [compost metagenome]